MRRNLRAVFITPVKGGEKLMLAPHHRSLSRSATEVEILSPLRGQILTRHPKSLSRSKLVVGISAALSTDVKRNFRRPPSSNEMETTAGW
jgi:hypothetical protein